MIIKSVIIKGFRCFDKDGQCILIDRLTCFVGPNASGKTSAIMALARMFGDTPTIRQITASDFHLEPGEKLKTKTSRELTIECRIAFPELEKSDTCELDAIPEFFNQMIVEEPDGTPYCRIRLEATWTDDNTPIGDIQQTLWWIRTDSDKVDDIKNARQQVQSRERSKIRVIYVPASRDPEQQVRTTTTTSFGRLLSYLAFGEAEAKLKSDLLTLQSNLDALAGLEIINRQVQQTWQGFYSGRVANSVAFRAFEDDPSEIIKLLVPVFSPGDDGQSLNSSDLGDGLRSLFSISLALGLYQVEELLRNGADELGFKADIVEKLPLLTIIGVEEPENHLSPQYLGRVTGELFDISKNSQAQVLIASHSPAILGRVDPKNVRYFLGDEQSPSTKVLSILLPAETDDDAYKFIREAVRGYPELYFARLVILGEGPSEEIVLRRIFEASGTPLDTHFISVVPLGGRHVNHFWRLLHGLQVKYITLLDLDREKEGAGWGRIQYVRDQLTKLYDPDDSHIQVKSSGIYLSLADERFDDIRSKPVTDIKAMTMWLEYLEKTHKVFFSAPLDIDFSMLEAFTDNYKATAPSNGGPKLPTPGTSKYETAIEARMRQVLASDPSSASPDLGTTYTKEQRELFAWYKYLFIDGSKPVTHMSVLAHLQNARLVADAPPALLRIVEAARNWLIE